MRLEHLLSGVDDYFCSWVLQVICGHSFFLSFFLSLESREEIGSVRFPLLVHTRSVIMINKGDRVRGPLKGSIPSSSHFVTVKMLHTIAYGSLFLLTFDIRSLTY